MVFYNAFLPDIAPAEKVGRTSGYGWGLGYAGGLVALILALAGLIQPEVPWFGFSTENGENIRATNLLVAGWLAIFSVPMFLFVHQRGKVTAPRRGLLRASFRELGSTLRHLRRHSQRQSGQCRRGPPR